MDIEQRIERLEARYPNVPPNPVALFCQQYLYYVPGARLLFREFYTRFQNWLPAARRYEWSRIAVSQALPEQFQTGRGNANLTYICNASWEAGPQDALPLVVHEKRIYKQR